MNQSRALLNHCPKCKSDEVYIRPTGYKTCKKCSRENLRRWRHDNGISKATRASYRRLGIKACSPEEYRAIARFGSKQNVLFVLKRDNYTCTACPMTNSEHKERFGVRLSIDHIDGNGRNSKTQNNDLNNLQTLCLPCHGRKDGKRRRNHERQD